MSEHNARSDLIVALRDEIARLHDDASGKELVIAALAEALKECADELEALVRDRYAGTHSYPSERYERDMEPVRRGRALLTPTTEPAKAEEP